MCISGVLKSIFRNHEKTLHVSGKVRGVPVSAVLSQNAPEKVKEIGEGEQWTVSFMKNW